MSTLTIFPMLSSRHSTSARNPSFSIWTTSARKWKPRTWTYNFGPSPSTESAWRARQRPRAGGSDPPCGLPQNRKRPGVVFSGSERSQVRDEQLDMLELRLLVLLEPEAKPAGGEAAVALGLF